MALVIRHHRRPLDFSRWQRGRVDVAIRLFLRSWNEPSWTIWIWARRLSKLVLEAFDTRVEQLHGGELAVDEVVEQPVEQERDAVLARSGSVSQRATPAAASTARSATRTACRRSPRPSADHTGGWPVSW